MPSGYISSRGITVAEPRKTLSITSGVLMAVYRITRMGGSAAAVRSPIASRRRDPRCIAMESQADPANKITPTMPAQNPGLAG